jgi:uncharacterized protein (UPF0332 family)
LSITTLDFLEFAEAQFNKPDNKEIDYRNIASRAYYFAFHCCLEFRSHTGKSDAQLKGSHDILYSSVMALPTTDEFHKLLKSMAYMAKMMKQVRTDADYHLSTNFELIESKQQLADAKKVLEKYNQIKRL